MQAISGQESLTLRAPVAIEAPGGFLHVGGRPYRDTLSVSAVGSECEVVNEVSLEEYLTGLVNAEFSSKWNEESIAAQVIAARTYGLYQIKQAELNREQRYDVDSTVKDQVYDGSRHEDFRAARIVNHTRGVVLASNSLGQALPLKAFYHSTCGGTTELPEQVWGGKFAGFKHAVKCPYCASSPRFHWHVELTSAEISSLILSGAGAGARPAGWPPDWAARVRQARLQDVRVRAIDAQARVTELVVSYAMPGAAALELVVPAQKFRAWMGATRFLSTGFQMIPLHEASGATVWRFDGRGNGHGVGMCQWGAKVMGEKGFRMAQILKFYYPDAILRKVW